MPPIEEVSETNERADIDLLNEESADDSSTEEDAKVDETADDDADTDIDDTDEDDSPATEDEEETIDEEKIDTEVPNRPTIAQIKAISPDIFKKLPGLRDMYFREQEFSKLFPTVGDAKTAYSAVEEYHKIRVAADSGDAEALLGSLENKDIPKLATKLLPALYKADKDAHWDAIAPVLEGVARQFFTHGKKSNNENVMNAALFLSDFLFGDIGIAKGEKTLSKQEPESAESKRLSDREKELNNRELKTFDDSVRSEGSRELKALILERGKGNKLKIDPEGVLTPFMKDTITEKIMIEVNTKMMTDQAHMRFMDSLWEKAKRDGYQGDWKAKIVSAFLARAKTLVPAIRAKLVSEALGTSQEHNEKKRETLDIVKSRREPGNGASSNGRQRAVTAKQIDWGKSSDLDVLNDRQVLKK